MDRTKEVCQMTHITMIEYWGRFTTEEKQYIVKILRETIPNLQIGTLPFIPLTKIWQALWFNPTADEYLKIELEVIKKFKKIGYPIAAYFDLEFKK